MESLDLLNLRAGECSFLEIALADVRHFAETFALANKKQVVLVFPPVGARNRFLIHTLVQNFFSELNTISIGYSYGRRTVVYHSSLKPMLRVTELKESDEIHDENNTNVHRPYRTPIERKAQEKLFQSLMPKKKIDESPRRKQPKRPDIPIYVPRALRGLANNNISNSISTKNSSNLTLPIKCNNNSRIEDDSSKSLCSKQNKVSSALNLNSERNNCLLKSLDSFKFIDFSNEMLAYDDACDEAQTSFNDFSTQILEPQTSKIFSDLLNVNECNLDSSVSKDIIKMESNNLEYKESESNIVKTEHKNRYNVSMMLDSSQCSSDNVSSTCIQNSTLVNLPDCQVSDIKTVVTPEDLLGNQNIGEAVNSTVIDNKQVTVKENIVDLSYETHKQQHEFNLGNNVVDSTTLETELIKEYNTNCPHYCLDSSFTSGPLSDIEEQDCKSEVEELTIQKSSESLEIKENDSKKKNSKKKKVLDVDECSWEDLYDKEDDYIHPLLMKELVSTMGKVQVQCTKEDYREHQTIEERSSDGECVIEVYGFSSDFCTVDLMNQFAAFRKNHFEIIWVDDTHALAVFESPNLADQALNMSFALVKTRPLKNAIKESKLRAETIVALPATRPKTCTAMARRLVSSALGLKFNVSPDLLKAERTMLANAKEKKIRDAQQKHNIWNNES